MGIAYGKSHTPFSIMLNQASELLASAKVAGSKDKDSGPYYSPSYIDFHLSTAFNRIDIADCRRTHLEIQPRNDGKKIRLWQKTLFPGRCGSAFATRAKPERKRHTGNQAQAFRLRSDARQDERHDRMLKAILQDIQGRKTKGRLGCLGTIRLRRQHAVERKKTTITTPQCSSILWKLPIFCERNDGARYAS